MMLAEVSASFRIASVLLSLGGAGVAIYLAKIIPPRMDQADRPRPTWWWLAAVVVATIYGFLVSDSFGWSLLPAMTAFGTATLSLTLIDLDHQLIPNRVLFPAMGIAGVLLAIGAMLEGDGDRLLRGILAGIVYFVVLLVVALIARGGFGMGDVKLALLLGLFLGYLGWGVLATGIILAVLLGGVASILVLLLTRKDRTSKFAYGPYLVLGSWIALFWGQTIADWYFNTGS